MLVKPIPVSPVIQGEFPWCLLVPHGLDLEFRVWNIMVCNARKDLRSVDMVRSVCDDEIEDILPSGWFVNNLLQPVVVENVTKVGVNIWVR